MSYSSLVSTEILSGQLNNPQWVVIDCRFKLTKTEQKEHEYLEAHIPGACYAHLDRDLSSPVKPGITGRHPLPDISNCVECFSKWGIGSKTQVVAYDDAGGAIAARLWWLLQWLGHEASALLDGGWQQWIEEGRDLEKGPVNHLASTFKAAHPKNWVWNVREVFANLNSEDVLLLDARNVERFQGVRETIDPIAGHIPGACNEPFQVNLDSKGLWKTPEVLHLQYLERFPELPLKKVVSYCGSGVTACHTFFALLYAGFGDTFIYPGSWSEWITDSSRPMAVGEENQSDQSS